VRGVDFGNSGSGGGFEYIGRGWEWSMRGSRAAFALRLRESGAVLRAADLPIRGRRNSRDRSGTDRKLLEITRGRAFVLFTSYAQMIRFISSFWNSGLSMLKQGDAPRAHCFEEFG